MKNRLKNALEDGLIFGVKWLTVLLVLLVGLSWWMGDYWTIRQQSAHGEQAYQFIARQQQQAKPAAP